MTAVQKANHIDDWLRVLHDLEIKYVDKAMVDWLGDTSRLDDNGRIPKPSPAAIRKEAWTLKNDDDRRNMLAIEKGPQLTEDEKWQKIHDYPPMGGSVYFPTRYTLADKEAWNAHRKAWFDSPDYPAPPEKARHREHTDLTVAEYWKKYGQPADAIRR